MIFFAIIILYSGTEIHEIFRLPVFVVHYIEHLNLDKRLTLTDFISQHYGNSINERPQDSKHHKLPFKSGDKLCYNGQYFFGVSQINSEVSHLIYAESIRYAPETAFNLPTGNHDCIWQPPRVI